MSCHPLGMHCMKGLSGCYWWWLLRECLSQHCWVDRAIVHWDHCCWQWEQQWITTAYWNDLWEYSFLPSSHLLMCCSKCLLRPFTSESTTFNLSLTFACTFLMFCSILITVSANVRTCLNKTATLDASLDLSCCVYARIVPVGGCSFSFWPLFGLPLFLIGVFTSTAPRATHGSFSLRICASSLSWVRRPPHLSFLVHIQLHSSRSLRLFPCY